MPRSSSGTRLLLRGPQRALTHRMRWVYDVAPAMEGGSGSHEGRVGETEGVVDVKLPEPGPRTDVKALFLDYLDFYRATVARKVEGLDEEALRGSAVPSGWSPAELVKHLVFMERRWLRW